jgi:hypothetical protein
MKPLRNFILLTALIITGLVACEKDKGPVIIRPAAVPVQSADTFISFENTIQPIFNGRCIMCHDEYHPFLDLRDSNSYKQLLFDGYHAPYVLVANPLQSILVRRLKADGFPLMPPGPPPLSQSNIDTIIIWIRQGAKNN